ncbi:hypothetical protein D3C87_1696360 [compost metagenome]
MSLDDIAVDNGCMAAFHVGGNGEPGLDRRHVGFVADIDLEARCLHRFRPLFAAAALRILVDRHRAGCEGHA